MSRNKTAMSIKWHEECLKNQEEHYKRLKEEQKQLKQRVYNEYQELQFYRLQIYKAKVAGKESFDPNLYLKKEKEKYD